MDDRVSLMHRQPGDIGLSHSRGVLPWLIRVFQRLRYRKGGAPHWNHAFLLVCPDPANMAGEFEDWIIIEAEAHGVQCSYLSEKGEFEIMDSRLDDRGRELAIAYAEQALGSEYGFWTIASIAANLLLPTGIQVTRSGTFICSGLVAHAMEHGGHVFPLKWEADEVMPADLSWWFTKFGAAYPPSTSPA